MVAPASTCSASAFSWRHDPRKERESRCFGHLLIGLGRARRIDAGDAYSSVFVVRLLGDLVPLEDRQLVGRAGALGIVPIAIVEGHEHPAALDPTEPNRNFDRPT